MEFSIVDLPCFSTALGPTDIKFRWPLDEDLERWDLTRPPKLKHIMTAGGLVGRQSLVRIQLKFEDGVETPLFDA